MWINWWARFYHLLELYILSEISSTMESLRIKLQQIALKTESALPIIIVVCSVTVAVFVPFSISNSHAIHTPGRKKYLKLLTGLSISFAHSKYLKLNSMNNNGYLTRCFHCRNLASIVATMSSFAIGNTFFLVRVLTYLFTCNVLSLV